MATRWWRNSSLSAQHLLAPTHWHIQSICRLSAWVCVYTLVTVKNTLQFKVCLPVRWAGCAHRNLTSQHRLISNTPYFFHTYAASIFLHLSITHTYTVKGEWAIFTRFAMISRWINSRVTEIKYFDNKLKRKRVQILWFQLIKCCLFSLLW